MRCNSGAERLGSAMASPASPPPAVAVVHLAVAERLVKLLDDVRVDSSDRVRLVLDCKPAGGDAVEAQRQ